MSSILKFMKTLRNNWKKTTFAACVLTYGANYAKESYEIETLMEKYCSIARMYGMHQLQPSERPRRVLVVLNPTANRRKAVKQFEQYCLPILHLAGICVDVIQTKSEGHARAIIEEHADPPDAFVIAGGDGTLSEGVTGLMRRGDTPAMLAGCPLAVLPLGRHNTFARSLFPNEGGATAVAQVRRLADASMAVVTERTQRADILKIETAPDAAPNKAVYALCGVAWGSYRDAHAKIDKYWYFGRLRKYAAYILNGYKPTLSWNCAGDISYTPPCPGCPNCCPQVAAAPQPAGRWWRSYQKTPPAPPNLLEINENCAKSTTRAITTADFNLTVDREAAALHLDIGPPFSDLTYWDFVTQGCSAENGAKRTVRETISARQIELRPEGELQQFYSIDNEEFEVKPIKVTLLPKLVQFFV